MRLMLLGPHHGGGGGGHHGGGFHPHGGGFFPGYYGTEYVAIDPCNYGYAPVLGSDGQVYGNACYAQRAGVAVVRSLNGLRDAASDTSAGLNTLAVLGVILLGAWVWLGGKKRRK